MNATIKILGFDSTEVINVKTGAFSRVRNGEMFLTESETWICLGAMLINNFGYEVGRLSVKELACKLSYEKDSLYFKNGKAKFRIMDLDHGTRRVWGRTVLKHEIFAI